jgi:hypothetical protein
MNQEPWREAEFWLGLLFFCGLVFLALATVTGYLHR